MHLRTTNDEGAHNLVSKPREMGIKVILVQIDFNHLHVDDYLSEFQQLSVSAGFNPIAFIGGTRVSPDAKLFVGSGKAAEILEFINVHQVELVLFNHDLSPTQERNLEKYLKCKVLDRTGLILHIFAQRAQTFEGKLQVELAQLEHQSTRLVRGWTHLERQKGGIGLRGGPGETQLEVDRRLIRQRIKHIKQRLEKVRHQRDLSRRARRRATIPSVSLVGYTNAGKSTLFNILTQAHVYAADQLFATLDPTLRRVTLPGSGPFILADTVGFIRDLPHELVEAFRATLEETRDADLLLHVIDASHMDRQYYIEEVNKVIEQIGAQDVPQLQVYNKCELTEQLPRIDRNAEGKPFRVWISALNGQGLDLLAQAISELLTEQQFQGDLYLSPTQAKFRASLYSCGAVVSESIEEHGGWRITVNLPRQELDRLLRAEPQTVATVL